MIEYGACRVYLMVVLVKWEREVLFTDKTQFGMPDSSPLYRTLVSHWDERDGLAYTYTLLSTLVDVVTLLWTYTSVRTSVRVVAHLPARVACDR